MAGRRRAESRGGRGSEARVGGAEARRAKWAGRLHPEALESWDPERVRGPWPARDAVLLSARTVSVSSSVVLELSSAPRSAGDRALTPTFSAGAVSPSCTRFLLDPFLPSRIPDLRELRDLGTKALVVVGERGSLLQTLLEVPMKCEKNQ